MKKLFVWDFHGVLEKGNENAVLEITNTILEKHQFQRRMSVEEGEFLYGRKWFEYFSYLLPETSKEEQIRLQQACFETSMNNTHIIAKHIQLNDYADEVLQQIERKGHQQILISNTDPKSLDFFIKSVGLEKYFFSGRSFAVDAHRREFATKTECLKTFMQDRQSPDKMISIGDSPGDMELTQAHPQAVGYLYSHPGRSHRHTVHRHEKIADLRSVLKEI